MPKWTPEAEEAFKEGMKVGKDMTEPTPNADEALAVGWLRSIGGASSIIGAVLGFAAGALAAIVVSG